MAALILLDTMKQQLISLSEQYLKALAKNLKPEPKGSMQPALKTGRQAAALGLKTFDLVQIHERALATLKLSNLKNMFRKPAEIFFTAVNVPIERKHSYLQQGKTHLKRLIGNLDQSIKKRADGNNQPQCNEMPNKNKNESIKKNDKCHANCLKESLELQKCLRQLTHRVLATQEAECKQISLELHDEIAQMLLGINVRLHSLKQQNRSGTNGLKAEIASARHLVVESAKRVRKFARELADTSKVPRFGLALNSELSADNSSVVRTTVQ